MAVSDLAPEDGEHIGAYRIVRLLGRGGMGEVFLCRDSSLHRSVAIKRIRPGSQIAPILRQRLLREAQAVSSLDHSAIVRVLHLEKCDGDDCIVMEHVQGETLAAALKDGPLELPLALRLAREVASGLDAAHRAGIIHRDLKAENVMITPSPAAKAKILDFGLAITANDPALTATGLVVGTRRCMSPEQLRGDELDGRSDLFSLGVLLYEMLTGSSPFQGANAQAILCQMFRSGAPPRVVALLERLLAQDPAARPQSAAEVVREIEAIEAGLSPGSPEQEETLSALPTAMGRWGRESQPSVAASPPRRRHLSKVTVVIVSLSLLVAGAMLLRWYAARPKLRRIFVAGPELLRDKPQDRLVAGNLQVVVLNILESLQGIAPIDPSEAAGSPGTPKEIASATATNEILIVLPEREGAGNRGWISLRFIRDGEEQWAERFQAALEPQELLAFNKNLDTKVRAHFPDNPRKPSASRSGGLLNATLRETDQAIRAFQAAPDPKARDRAFSLVKQAEALSPGDYRPLQERFLLELAEGELGMAASTLSQLEDRMPSHALYLTLRVQLEEAQERLAEALSDQLTVVKETPSWTNLLKLAKLEERQGLVSDARHHLERILQDSPDNTWAKERLAELELEFGHPEEAETIYRRLLAGSSDPTTDLRFRNNLGTALLLLHRYGEAVTTFREALAKYPNEIGTTINLADAESGSCHRNDAAFHYREAHRLLEAKRLKGELDSSDDTSEAQCLAQVGELEKAKEIATRNLKQSADDATRLQTAALVFTLAGNDDQALSYIEEAIDKGIRKGWFTSPPYSSLFKNPRFQKLVAGEALSPVSCQDLRGGLVKAAPPLRR